MAGIEVSVDTTKWKAKAKSYRLKVHTKLDAEIKATALEVDRFAKKLVPVDTARLKSSIHPQFKGTAGYQYTDEDGGSYNGFINVTLGVFEAIVGTNVEYAQKIEDREQFLEIASKEAQLNFDRRLSKIFK